MFNKDVVLFEYLLLPGYIFLNAEPSLISTVLGSNVAVSLWDQNKKRGGMANYLYPDCGVGDAATSRYGNVAIRHLARMLVQEGTKRKDIKAQIFGGAETEERECIRIARRNVSIAKKIMLELRIEIISEDTGGSMGRKIVYNTEKNEAIVYKVNGLRGSDWYPYVNDRGEN
ncbi:MAG: chemotaxis protein CheD [Syntrophales bacterium]|jgi:chemotaxis protein CheD|nr:chemotaxis protein CheD [Syntrophales bacterium]